MNYKADFHLGTGTYFLNHSVGLQLKRTAAQFEQAYLAPWQAATGGIWPAWLAGIDGFNAALATLFNADQAGFCPQPNVSSGLTKLVMALPRLQTEKASVLMSEIDFPTIGFVLQHALPNGADQIRFIPQDCDVTDPAVWEAHLTADVGAAFISHAYSNTGQQAPLAALIPTLQAHDVLTIIDVAQSAGIIPLDFEVLAPDFVVGTCVKWLCGGPGAGYLWINPTQIAACQPKDVGWFSHAAPFEFDIHNFDYHPTALRFWGGTPSVAPYLIATDSINYFNAIGSQALRMHNQALIDQLSAAVPDAVVSPRQTALRNGTVVLNVGARQADVVAALDANAIHVDQRVTGMRVSPHIYNDEADVARFVEIVKGG